MEQTGAYKSYYSYSVVSSFIDSIGYDVEKKKLIIVMHKRRYHINDFPFAGFRAFATADSVGSFYNNEIKPNYTVLPGDGG